MAKTLEQKLKRWNRNPKRHYYHIFTEYNVRPINEGRGHSWNEFNKNFYAFDEEHALYQFHKFAEENNMLLNHPNSLEITEVA